ncbi:MAG: hypothetical protein ACRER2_01205 [Methylococcales bacterium]
MNDLLEIAISAHGGLKRWNELKTGSAHLENGGALWPMKGHPEFIQPSRVTVSLHKQKASHEPFLKPNQRTSVEPNRVAIETFDGRILEERTNPRDSFKGHVLETPWDQIQLAYFAGYAMWTYLNTPFLFAMPGVATEEIQPWQENGETWRRLKATFPPSIATHSTVQTFYFDKTGLLKRHDYDVEIAGGSPAAHYVSELKEFSGIIVPTKRKVLGRQPDGTAIPEPVIVSIDLSEIQFS